MPLPGTEELTRPECVRIVDHREHSGPKCNVEERWPVNHSVEDEPTMTQI